MLGSPGSEEKYTAMKMFARLHAASHSIFAEEVDGLLLATVHVYLPLISPVTFRVWRYFAVIGFTNTVSFPSVTGVVSLVQMTVVAGPPVEIQVRVNRGLIPSVSTVGVKQPYIDISPVNNNCVQLQP